MTGREIYKLFSEAYDAAFSAYVTTAEANRIFRKVVFIATDKKYLTLSEQKTFDELSPQISTENVFQVNNNKIFTAPLGIVNITFGGGNAIVTTLFPHNLITGDTVIITGTIFTAPTLTIDGTYSVVVTGTSTFTFVFAPPIGIYTQNTGQITFSKLVADYMHITSVKCKYTEPQIGLWITTTTGVSPIAIVFNQRNKFRDKSRIQLSNMTGTPAANGTWYYKQYNTIGGALYQNEDLTIKSTGGTPSPNSQGSVSYIWYNEAKPKFADRSIDPYEEATPDEPQFETADKFIKFYPANRTCTEITLAYIKIPQVFIDCTNVTRDYSLYYPEKYIYFLISVAIRLLSTELRDQLLAVETSTELQTNP